MRRASDRSLTVVPRVVWCRPGQILPVTGQMLDVVLRGVASVGDVRPGWRPCPRPRRVVAAGRGQLAFDVRAPPRPAATDAAGQPVRRIRGRGHPVCAEWPPPPVTRPPARSWPWPSPGRQWGPGQIVARIRPRRVGGQVPAAGHAAAAAADAGARRWPCRSRRRRCPPLATARDPGCPRVAAGWPRAPRVVRVDALACGVRGWPEPCGLMADIPGRGPRRGARTLWELSR